MMKSLLLLLLGLLPAAALAVPPLYTVTAASGKDDRASARFPPSPSCRNRSCCWPGWHWARA
jgi:hypothetical protein